MITKEEIIALNDYFYTVPVPDELQKFVKKLDLLEKELQVKTEMDERLKEIHEELLKLSEKNEE